MSNNSDKFSVGKAISEHEDTKKELEADGYIKFNGTSAKTMTAPEPSKEDLETMNHYRLMDMLFPVRNEEKTTLLAQLRTAEIEKKKTERRHQHAKAKMYISSKVIEAVKNKLELKKTPTAKQIESYIRLKTEKLEIERERAEIRYNSLLRIYELI